MRVALCFHVFGMGKTLMGKSANRQYREQTSKHKQRVTRQTEHVHRPDRLAAALAVMPANNSSSKACLTAVNIGTESEEERDCQLC